MEKERLYYIDWLRVLVVLSLIPYHAALSYVELGDIYIRTPLHDIRVLPFLLVAVPLRGFFMTLLFFVSGIAAYYSLKYRGRNKYLRERVRKIMIPLILGTLILCPVQAYTKALYNGFSGNLIKFVPEFFSYKFADYLGYAHFWFLLYLFIFSCLLLPLFTRWMVNESERMKISHFVCKGNNVYIPILFIVAAEMFLRPFFPGPQTLIGDWANDVVYLSVFIFGFIFASDAGIQARICRLSNVSKRIVFVLMPIYIGIEYFAKTESSKFLPFEIVLDITKGLYECAAIIFLLWLGKKYLNKKSAVLGYLNKVSFPVYMMHFVPVSMFTYLFTAAGLNVYLKYFLVVGLSYLSVFIVCSLLFRKNGNRGKIQLKSEKA